MCTVVFCKLYTPLCRTPRRMFTSPKRPTALSHIVPTEVFEWNVMLGMRFAYASAERFRLTTPHLRES